MGSGKTGATMWALNNVPDRHAGDWDQENWTGDRVLVLAPLRVASGTWPVEQTKFQFPALRVVDGTGSRQYREDIMLNDDSNVVCCNYDSWNGSSSSGATVGRSRSYQAFTDRWFVSVQEGAHHAAKSYKPRGGADTEIHQRLRTISLTVDAAAYFFGCDKPVTVPVVVPLPSKARKVYDQMEKELFAQLEAGEVEAANAAARTQKCLQIASGAVYVTAYQYQHDRARILKKFPERWRWVKALPVIARLKPGTVVRFRCCWCTPASAGHGLNLQDGGCHLAFLLYDLELRALRTGFNGIVDTTRAKNGDEGYMAWDTGFAQKAWLAGRKELEAENQKMRRAARRGQLRYPNTESRYCGRRGMTAHERYRSQLTL
ncbi:hypothetical protein GH714_044146 [Hevea brasiliensis]|uniref:SNF2 N-terminal domain-containing protein n=1 Tax=Hevea brasiliensis TaxID=3981 RepID=A0A6A6K0I0_HEVBR|nr:hypothetical protein GH714_044146 [Hevea brasiliensis]